MPGQIRVKDGAQYMSIGTGVKGKSRKFKRSDGKISSFLREVNRNIFMWAKGRTMHVSLH